MVSAFSSVVVFASIGRMGGITGRATSLSLTGRLRRNCGASEVACYGMRGTAPVGMTAVAHWLVVTDLSDRSRQPGCCIYRNNARSARRCMGYEGSEGWKVGSVDQI